MIKDANGINKNPDAETPFWWLAAPPEVDNGEVPPDNCDVAIVGSGYTGITAALYLAAAGRKVVVLDREAVGFGASTRNGGIASGNIRLGVEQAKQQFGVDKARKFFGEGVAARDHLRELITTHNIDCDYQLNGRFTGALTEKDLQNMSREVEQFSELTGIEAYSVEKNQLSQYIGSDIYVGGVIRTDIAHFHPGKLHRGLLTVAREKGACVIGYCGVEQIDKQDTGAGFRLQTARGQLLADEVIMATNGYNQKSLDSWLTKRIVAVRSRIIVTESVSKNLISTLSPNLRAMGENRKLFRYFRPGPDGDRMIFGSREPLLNTNLEKAIEHVRRGMVGVFPDLADAQVESSWAGNVAFSRSELPLLFQHDGIHYAMGYCGSGTVWAPWFGKQLAEKIITKDQQAQQQSLFFCEPPAAIPLYNGRPWFIPAAMAWEGIQDRLQGRH